MRALLIALRTTLYMSAFVLLWGWLALSVERFDARLGGALPGWTPAVGGVLLTAGTALALVCAALFVARGHGTPAPFDPPRTFVAQGPYRWVRNPIYLAGVALLVGFGLIRRSPAMLLFAAGFFGLIHLLVVLWEEPDLERRFGEGYRRYRRRVRRWLPGRPRETT